MNKLPWDKVFRSGTATFSLTDEYKEGSVARQWYIVQEEHAQSFRKLCELAMSIPAQSDTVAATRDRKKLRLFAIKLWREIFEKK